MPLRYITFSDVSGSIYVLISLKLKILHIIDNIGLHLFLKTRPIRGIYSLKSKLFFL